MNSISQRASQELLRENICLDYVNPVIAGEENDYFFSTYERLLDWGVAVGTVSAAEASALLESSAAAPRSADSALQYAGSVRDGLKDILVSVAAAGAPRKSALDVFNDAYVSASTHRRLDVRKGRFTWTWPPRPDLGSVWWPVLPAAADLLLSPQLSRLKSCTECGWLFLDASKNQSRRWCRMKDCGNRQKARIFRQKNQA